MRFRHAVTESAYRLDERRAEFAPEPCDEDLDCVGVPVKILRVYVLGKLRARYDPSVVVHQIRKHTEFMAGQLDGKPTHGDARVAYINSKRATPKFGLGEATGAANERSNAGQEFFHPERLCDVVVRAAVDSLHFLVPTAASGQNENGDQDTPVPPAPKQGEPIHFR